MKQLWEGIWRKILKNDPLGKLIYGSSGNRNFYFKTWFAKAATVIGVVIAVWQMPDILWGFKINGLLEAAFGGDMLLWNSVTLIVFLVICVITILITRIVSRSEIKNYLHKVVETERPGCRLELRVSDSYLTNAFLNYPKCAMVIGINKAFLFEEAEAKSLIADMWKELKDRGIDKHEVQVKIDEALKILRDKHGDEILDNNRPQVQVKSTRDGESKFVIRDNYKIGTMIGVDLKWIKVKEDKNTGAEIKETKLKKLYLIANSEIVQGRDVSEPMIVSADRNASVVENYNKIWDYFEEEEKLNEYPPEHKLYAPLLIPLIGGGVANEAYSDIEMFSTIVDLYFEKLRDSIRQNKKPEVGSVIINIRDNTAIKGDKSTNAGRKIDLETAFWYMDYRSKVRPVKTN